MFAHVVAAPCSYSVWRLIVQHMKPLVLDCTAADRQRASKHAVSLIVLVEGAWTSQKANAWYVLVLVWVAFRHNALFVEAIIMLLLLKNRQHIRINWVFFGIVSPRRARSYTLEHTTH